MDKEVLKFYVNRDCITSKLAYVPLLFPFLGPILKDTIPYLNAAFKQYNFDKLYYELTDDIKEADFVLIPHNYWYFKEKFPGLLKKSVNEALENDKLILIDAQGDFHKRIKIKNAYILRNCQYRFKLRKNEIIIPAPAEDLLETYFEGNLQTRDKNPTPLVGFAGFAKMPFLTFLKSFVKAFFYCFAALFDEKRGVFKKGGIFRSAALKILKKSNLINTNFVIRKFYSGHTATIHGDFETLRREFINNIINSDYTLCVKGDGNYSIRFYETLSLGRIPLFVDTETVLPMEDVLNYKEFCVFADFRDLKRVDKILAEFHNNISNSEFIEMQKKARAAFEENLRMDKFTKYLMGKLKEIASCYYKKH